MKNSILGIVFLSIALVGCEQATNEGYKKEVVVNATLTAGLRIDTLRLLWTGEVDKFYNPAALAISNATVIIRGIDVNFYDSLFYDNRNPGRYFSSYPRKVILPTKSYSMAITIPGWPGPITATTTVPDTFSIISATVSTGDTIEYNPLAPVSQFFWSPSNFQGSYLPTIAYLDANAAMIPKVYYGDTTSSDFQRPPKMAYRSGLPKDQTNTDLPWVFLSYFGNLQIDVYAVDNNYSDFINQILTAQGGELTEIRYNIQGGIGVFGSRTKAAGGMKVYLKP